MFTGSSDNWTWFQPLAPFMLCGSAPVFLRGFAPGKKPWVTGHAAGRRFESRFAPARGNLFALVNIAAGLVLECLPTPAGTKRRTSGLAFAGMLMPPGIVAGAAFAVPFLASPAVSR